MNINDINNLVVKFMSAESILQKNRKEIIDDCEKSTHECRMIAIRSGCFKEADEAIAKINERTAEVLEAYTKVEGMLNTIRPLIIAIIQKESGENITISSKELEQAITLFDSLDLDNLGNIG